MLLPSATASSPAQNPKPDALPRQVTTTASQPPPPPKSAKPEFSGHRGSNAAHRQGWLAPAALLVLSPA